METYHDQACWNWPVLVSSVQGRGRHRGTGCSRVGISDDREGLDRRKIRVSDQARAISRQERLPTDGNDLNVGEAKMIPQRGFEAELLVTPLDYEQLEFLDLDAHPRTSKRTSRTASIASSS